MSVPWLCASCRQQLLRQSHRPSHLYRAPWRASFISFPPPATDNGEAQDEDEGQNKRDTPRGQAPGGRRRPPGNVPWQFDRSVEDDFLERLFEGRNPSTGPYSNPLASHQARARSYPVASQQPPEALESGGSHGNDSSDAAQPTQTPTATSTPSRSSPSQQTTQELHRSHNDQNDGSITQLLRSQVGFNPFSGSATTPDIDIDLQHPTRSEASQHVNTRADDSSVNSTPGVVVENSGQEVHHQNSQAKQQTAEELRNEVEDILAQLAAPAQPIARSKSSVDSQTGVMAQEQPDGSSSRNDVGILPMRSLGGMSYRPFQRKASGRTDQSQMPEDRKKKHGNDMISHAGKDRIAGTSIAKAQDLFAADPHSPSKRWSLDGAARIVDQWCRAGLDKSLPTPTQVAADYTNHYRSRNSKSVWVLVVWRTLVNTIHHLHRMGNQPQDTHTARLIGEIIRLWNLGLQLYGECYVKDSLGVLQQIRNTTDWQSFMSSEQMSEIRQWSTKDFGGRLVQFFPRFGDWRKQGPEFAAIATFAVIRLVGKLDFLQDPELARQGQSLAEFLNSLLMYSNAFKIWSFSANPFKSHQIETSDIKTFTASLQDVLETSAVVLAEQSTAIQESGDNKLAQDPGRHRQALAALFERRIGRVLESKNAPGLERLWSEAQTSFKKVARDSNESTIPSSVYCQFLIAFMTLDSSTRGIEIWNLMIADRVQPEAIHWDAMLKGCGNARNATAIRDFWTQLMASGTPVDARLWCTRMRGLISCGYLDEAMRAFMEMTRSWLRAVDAKPDSTDLAALSDAANDPKPNTHCVNVLVIGALKRNNYPKVVEIISWAKTLGIQLDAFTFNPVIGAALQESNTALAERLLKQMLAMGVKPDVATFTILLEYLLRDPDCSHLAAVATASLSSDSAAKHDYAVDISDDALDLQKTIEPAQGAAVSEIFSVMAQQSLQPSGHTFSVLVAGLLKLEPPKVQGAYTILHQMVRHKLPLSARVYTIIASFHFNEDPPDLAAVEALWHHARAQKRGHAPMTLDATFFGEFCKGWTDAGEPRKAFEVWDAAKQRKVQLPWTTLHHMVQSLLKGGYSQSAQEVVDKAISEEHSTESDRGRMVIGRERFFTMARSEGLSFTADVC